MLFVIIARGAAGRNRIHKIVTGKNVPAKGRRFALLMGWPFRSIRAARLPCPERSADAFFNLAAFAQQAAKLFFTPPCDRFAVFLQMPHDLVDLVDKRFAV